MGWADAPAANPNAIPAKPKWSEAPPKWQAAPAVGPTRDAAAALSEMPEVQGPRTGETGLLSDPVRDREAWLRAQAMDSAAKNRLTGRFGEAMDAMAEGITMNVDRPISGLISALMGDGYDYGKAVDAYADEARDARLGGVGTAAELVGSVLTPSPTGKQKLLIEALQGGAQAGIEGENLSTEGQNRTMGDRATDVAIGTGVTGALSGLGRAIKPGELIDTPKVQSEVNAAIRKALEEQKIDRVETSGLALREALMKEQGALKAEGKSAMANAVKGDFTVVPTAGASVLNSIDNAYNSLSDAPIPITPQGTPAAAAFKDQITMEVGKGNDLTIGQIDALRIKARGLRTSAANATDKKALNDLEKSLDRMVDDKIKSGEFFGSKEYNEAYRAGRAKYEAAMKISDLPKVKQILKDETIPGAAIADSLLSINTSSKAKSPAKLASVITETLGEGSESLGAVRQGVLATMFEGADASPEAQARLLKTLERNETLIGELFTPDQVSELASIRVDLANAANAKDKIAASARNEKRIQSFLSTMTQGLAKATAKPGTAGAVTTVASGSASAGMTVAGLLGTMKIAASRPVRATVSATSEALAKPMGRQASQNENIEAVPRDMLIQMLGGPQ
jgi:hypothetical protein